MKKSLSIILMGAAIFDNMVSSHGNATLSSQDIIDSNQTKIQRDLWKPKLFWFGMIKIYAVNEEAAKLKYNKMLKKKK